MIMKDGGKLSLGIALLCFSIINVAYGRNARLAPSNYGGQLRDAQHSLVQYDEDFSEGGLPMLSRDLTLLSYAIESIKGTTCRNHCRLILSEIQNLTSWAVKFYDASGKFPDGLLSGSTFQLGNFDECLDIDKSTVGGMPYALRGQYCLARVSIRVPEVYVKRANSIWASFRRSTRRYHDALDELRWGICVPSSCTARDVEQVIRRILYVTFAESPLALAPEVSPWSCYTGDVVPVDSNDMIYLCLMLTIVTVILIATIFDAVYTRNKSRSPDETVPQVLLAFSLISNWKKLCSPAHDDGLNLDCISGIKFVAMGFIIAGHTLIFLVGGPVLNKSFWQESISKIHSTVFLNNPLLVDTFLLLSGFLLCRLLLKELDKKGSINFSLLYIYRYLRLTPVYLVLVGFYATWLSKFDSGPLWYRMELEKERCQASWWANVLYINNYVNTDQLCMFQSWYLSVDTQLFLLAPAVVYPLWRCRKLGEIILAFVTFMSMLIPFVATLVDHLDPTLMIYTSELQDISTNNYFKNTYIKTHMRASAYCFGLVYGYIVYRVQTSNYQLTKDIIRIGWVFGSLSLIIGMTSIGVFYGPRKDFTPIEAAVYSTLHRALWSVGTGWVLIACITDNSGPLRSFLKWRPFVPLSRLTYSAYLINGLVELHSSSTIRSPQYLGVFSLFSKIMSHMTLTFLGAAVLSMMFESPILGIERIFLNPKTRSSPSETKCISEETITTTNS